jgi:outer membrane protein TolC
VTLQDGLKVVTSSGYGMRIALAREAAAVKGERIAGAGLKPRVNAYADQTWLQYRPEAVFGGGTSPLGDDKFLRYGFTVKQLITDFGRTGSGVEAARAETRARKEETSRTRNQTVLDFVTSYVSLLQTEKSVKLAGLKVQRFESHVSDARALYEAGEVTLNDVLAAEVVLADARQKLITAADDRKLAVSRLNYLMLRPLDADTTVVDYPYMLDPIPALAEISAWSGSARPELGILDEQIKTRKALLSSNKAQRFPSLFVSGGYEFEENPYRVHEDNWSATVGITWDLYTGGGTTAAQKQIEDELSALVIQREQLKELISLEIRDSHRLLLGAHERTLVAIKALTLAEESLRLQRSRYTEGEATATDVTDAVTSLAEAENNHWSAVYGRLEAEARVLYAAGRNLEEIYSNSRVSEASTPFSR